VARDLLYIVHQRHRERMHRGARHSGEEHRQQRQETWPGADESLQSGNTSPVQVEKLVSILENSPILTVTAQPIQLNHTQTVVLQ
jgi:hypothetical protein